MSEEKPVTMPSVCGTCRFSSPARADDGKINFQARICRRREPQGVIVPDQRGMPSLRYLWPVLGTMDWCGEFQPNGSAALLPGEQVITDVLEETKAS